MKFDISGVPLKKGLLYLLILGLLSNNLKANSFIERNLTNGNIACVLAAGMGVSVMWALYERISKNTIKGKNNKLEEEINEFKSDDKTKEHLVKVSDFVTRWQNFLAEIKDFAKNSANTEEELARDIINFITHHSNKYAANFDEYNRRVNQGVNDLSDKANELSIKEKDWKDKSVLIEASTKLISSLRFVSGNLSEYAKLIEKHKNYLKLIQFLDQGIEREYTQEVEYAFAEIANWPQVIDQIIRAKNGQALFPYLSYIQNLTGRLETLSKLLNSLSNVDIYSFQREKIQKAQHIYDSLQVIVKYISSSDILATEKTAKIEYDKREQYVRAELEERKERLRLETKERESKTAQEKAVAEAKLLDQKNKENRLANEKAQIEKDKKELEFKHRQNELELGRILQGKALDENNNKWRTDYNNLDVKYRNEVNRLQTDLQNLRNKLASTEANIRGTQYNQADIERYTRNLEIKLSNVFNALDLLTKEVNNPPFNPEAYGLSNYIKGLRQQVDQLKTLVS